jgi:hypothetical protein
MRTITEPQRRPVERSQPSLVFLGPLLASSVYKRAPELVDGWACTHIHHKLWKPPSSWGKYSIGPLTTGLWPPGASVVGPVVLCGRCSKKRNVEGFHFWNGQYRTATPEELKAFDRACSAGPPPLASQAKAGSK